MGQIKNIKLHIVTDIKIIKMSESLGSRPLMCFEVEKVIGVSSDGSYQVQWAPAWVSKFHLVGCEHLIQEFLQRQQQQKQEQEEEQQQQQYQEEQQHQQQYQEPQQQQQPQELQQSQLQDQPPETFMSVKYEEDDEKMQGSDEMTQLQPSTLSSP